MVGVFNFMIGALGGPLLALKLGQHFEVEYPALTLIIAFLAAYVAHDLFSKMRGPLVALAHRFLGRAPK